MTAPPRESLFGAQLGFRPARTGTTDLSAWAHWTAPVLLLALTAALAGYRLGAKSLSHDEAFSLAVARGDAHSFWQALLDQEAFAGFYYAILRGLPVLWDSEAALRLPSVGFAVLSTITCYAVARRLFGFRVAVLAALLLDVNLLFLRYAQEARPYALALWLVTLAGWLLIRAVQRPSWPSWLAYGAVCALAAYAHYVAVLVVAGQALSLLVHRSLVPWRRAAAAAGLFIVLLLPLSVVLLATNAGGRPLLARTPVLVLIRELAGVAATSRGALQGSVYALCCLAVIPAVIRQYRLPADTFLRWRFTLLVCWVAVPIMLAAAVSTGWPIFVTRYFVVCLPAAALLVAAGLNELRPPLQVVLLLIVTLLAAPALRTSYLQDVKEGEDWRDLVRYVSEEARPGDEVIFLSRFGRRPFEFYLARSPGLAAALSPAYPSLPWGDYPPVVGERQVAAPTTEAAALQTAGPPRVWAVLLWGGFRTGDDDGRPFAQLLARDYEKRDHRFFGRYLKLDLYERRLDAGIAPVSVRLPVLGTQGERPPRVRHAAAQQIPSW